MITVYGLKSSVQSFGVNVDFTALKNSSGYLKGLSAKLQRRDIDVFEAFTIIDNISYIVTEEEMPTVQCNRSNVPADTPLLYYKRSIAITFIDILLQQLQNHFSGDKCWPGSALLSLIRACVVCLLSLSLIISTMPSPANHPA